ncbi:MAG: hypothetical protein ACPG6V_06540 [Flavobacteriales bacterium]
MKKNIFGILVCAVVGFTTQMNAQELGLRFGNVLENNVAIDALVDIKNNSRVHANLSFSDRGLGVSALWNLSFLPINDYPDLHWYVGAGPYTILGKDFDLGLASEIGVEYQFIDFPMTIGLDWRPQLEIVDHTTFRAGGFGLNVRYQFSK